MFTMIYTQEGMLSDKGWRILPEQAHVRGTPQG